MPAVKTELRPFLKWAGGKRQLLPQLRRFYPQVFHRYFEPFVGSGAVFFDLWTQGRLVGRRATLTDANADLIGTYLRVRDSVDTVVSALEQLAAGHAEGGPNHYYDVRDRRFNPARHQWWTAGGRVADYPASLAAMLIYLNRTGYNGLFRLNARGQFNVPAGRYAAPRIVDPARLRAIGAVLSCGAITIAKAPFDRAARRATAGDLVYFDPPYAPMSSTASFRAYTSLGFAEEDQRRLQEVVVELARRGVAILLSNSSAPSVLALYERDPKVRDAGLVCWRVPARRAINSRAERRGAVEELLVTNVRPDSGSTNSQ